MSAKQIVLDTETTGLLVDQGHRVVEVACAELSGRQLSETWFHHYVNPQRAIDAGAKNVHGLDEDFLSRQPVFADIAEEFLRFVNGAELLTHNARFDIGFLNRELQEAGASVTHLDACCKITDTLLLAREKYPMQRNSLAALCKRYRIDDRHRAVHGAKVDVELLAKVYVHLVGGQASFLADTAAVAADAGYAASPAPTPAAASPNRAALSVIRASAQELDAHRRYLEMLEQQSPTGCVWLRGDDPPTAASD